MAQTEAEPRSCCAPPGDARVAPVALGPAIRWEPGRARPTTTPPTAVAYGPMWGGPAAETLWMRLSYHYDRSGNEHEVRAGTSTDGVHWTWTGAWTLPKEQTLRIGLVSLNTAGATARFDYVHTYGG